MLHKEVLSRRVSKSDIEAYAEKKVDLNKIDKHKLKKIEDYFKENPNVLRSFDMWLSIADRTLIKDLLKLTSFINTLYKFKNKPIVYRGFDISSGFQEKLDYSKKDLIGTMKNYDITMDRAISFTSDINIARDFGGYIIKIVDYDLSKTLVITDELYKYISTYRNLSDVMSQEEYILFGEQTIVTTLIENKNSFFW